MTIIEKIRKLMLKAESGATEQEAMALLNKAYELMEKHNIDMDDVEDEEQNLGILANEEVFHSDWRTSIWLTVSKLFFCDHRYVDRYHKSATSKRYRPSRVHLVTGTQANAIMVANYSKYIIKTIIRLARKAADEHGGDLEYSRSFIDACSMRVLDRLEEMYQDKRENEYLKLIYEQAETVNSMYADEMLKKKSKSLILNADLDGKGSRDGFAAGDTVNLDQQVGGSDNNAKIA
jgi:hypothetical protein